MCDLFYDINNLDMANYTDYNTPYTFSPLLDATLTWLKKIKMFEWFHKNGFKSNVDKCNHITTSKSQPLSLKKKFKLKRLLCQA